MDYSPPGSSVHGILQARILEWVAISFMGSSRSRDRTQVSCVAGRFFTIWATREAPRWHSKSESRSVQLFPLHFSFYVNYKYKFVLCLVTKLCSTLCHPMDCSPPGPSVLGDSPGGLPYPPPGDLPNQGSNPGLPHHGKILYSLSPREAQEYWVAYPFSRGSSLLHCRRILYQLELPGKSHMLVDTHIKSQCIILLISGVLILPAART